MIELQQAMKDSMLILDDTHTDLDKPFDIADAEELLNRGLEYTEDDVEDPGKEEPELEEDSCGLEPAPIELEAMSDMHEELTQLPSSPELEAVSILMLPTIATEETPSTRRSTMRRRRSEEQDENAVNATDAGESDAVMTYLREIGRVPMITHDREIELAQRIEMGDREAMKQFILANLRLVVSIAKRYVGRGLISRNLDEDCRGTTRKCENEPSIRRRSTRSRPVQQTSSENFPPRETGSRHLGDFLLINRLYG
jgi:RNA polymerase primary sigma factor